MRPVRIPRQPSRQALTIAGGYRIAEAYCNILSGKKVPEVSFMRTPLRLYDGTTQEPTDEKNTEKATEVINRTRELFTWSWRSLVQKGVKLATRDLLHPRRVESTIYIPEKQIRAWREESEKQNISVTDHDLLSAFIYQVCRSRLQVCPQVLTHPVCVRAIPSPRLYHHIRHPTTTPEPDPNTQLLHSTPNQHRLP